MAAHLSQASKADFRRHCCCLVSNGQPWPRRTSWNAAGRKGTGPTLASSPVAPSRDVWAAQRCLELPQVRARGSHVPSPPDTACAGGQGEALCGYQPPRDGALQV